MEKDVAEIVFWIGHLPLMILFLVGMWLVFANWLRGSVGGREDISFGEKFGILVRVVLATVFSARLWLLIKAFVVEVWFNRRLYHNDFWRWLNHFLLLTGTMLLFTLSGISALSVKVLIHFFHLEYIPIIGMWAQPDHPGTAFLNEIGAVMITIGLTFFIIRRYFTHRPQLRTGPVDTWMVVGFGLIILSGWSAEIVRLNSAAYTEPATSWFAFVGRPILAPLFGWLPLDWDNLTYWLYVIHGLITSIVIVTIPFSKFMHAIAGGLTLMVRDVEEQTKHIAEKGAARVSA